MGRKCDLCNLPALRVVVDQMTGSPVGLVDPDLPILDTSNKVEVVQERFCRLHRKKTLRFLARQNFLEEVEPRPYFTSAMTDAEPAPRALETVGPDYDGVDEDE